MLEGRPRSAAFAQAHPPVGKMCASVLEGPGRTEPKLRQTAAEESGEVPPRYVKYLTKLKRHAYKITDEDVAALKREGSSEDEILEVSIAGALGAALLRLERGLQSLEKAP